MGMNVNFTGTKMYQPNDTKTKTKKIATYAGAGVGLAVAARNTYKYKDLLNFLVKDFSKTGSSPLLIKGGIGVGVGVGAAILAGAGALVGKGVGKIINHFRKDDASKPEKKGKEQPTIKVTGEGEFKVEPGHPRRVYKKNPETGDWDFQTEVYDGSWGKPCSDEDLVNNLTKKVY